MARSLILETTFSIDLERLFRSSEPRSSENGSALLFLETHTSSKLYLTFTILGELAAGASMADRQRRTAFIQPFKVLESSQEVTWRYGEIYRFLRANGLMIGSNDIWIAATALAHDLPLVTRNEKHFRRVPGLTVVDYI